MPKSKKNEKSTLSFENAMTALEDAVRRLESGSLTLEESLTVFSEATVLVRTCNAALENAKQRVRVLTETADGVLDDAPFTASQDDE